MIVAAADKDLITINEYEQALTGVLGTDSVQSAEANKRMENRWQTNKKAIM